MKNLKIFFKETSFYYLYENTYYFFTNEHKFVQDPYNYEFQLQLIFQFFLLDDLKYIFNLIFINAQPDTRRFRQKIF